MSFKPIQKLKVSRTLSTGVQVEVGTWRKTGKAFIFSTTKTTWAALAICPRTHSKKHWRCSKPRLARHQGLHGVFSDSLPDGWGLLLQDRVFRQHGILPNLLTQMDRLALVGQGAVGALAYAPNSEYAATTQGQVDLSELGQQAQAVFEGQTGEVLQALVASGSSGGARPKALVYTQAGNWAHYCSTQPKPGDQAWLVKFTSRKFALGPRGRCLRGGVLAARRATST